MTTPRNPTKQLTDLVRGISSKDDAQTRQKAAALAKQLIDCKADINFEYNTYSTLLSVVVAYGHVELAETFLQAGACIDFPNKLKQTPLFIAAQNGHTRIVELLLDKKAHVNRGPDSFGGMPIHHACGYGHIDTVSVLLERNADAHSTTTLGATPLSIANQQKNESLIKLLAKYGAIYSKIPIDIPKVSTKEARSIHSSIPS